MYGRLIEMGVRGVQGFHFSAVEEKNREYNDAGKLVGNETEFRVECGRAEISSAMTNVK